MAESASDEPRRSRTFERLDALLWALVGAAIIWGASSITSLSAQAAAQREQIAFLTEMVRQLRDDVAAGTAAQYTPEDAARDLIPLRRSLNDHETRLRVLEGYGRGRQGDRPLGDRP